MDIEGSATGSELGLCTDRSGEVVAFTHGHMVKHVDDVLSMREEHACRGLSDGNTDEVVEGSNAFERELSLESPYGLPNKLLGGGC